MISKKLALLFLFFHLTKIEPASGWVEPEDTREDKSLYDIGVAISDVTGPAYGIPMMGYAEPTQVTKGIHMRIYSRAFIIGDGTRRLVFVNVDSLMIGSLLKMKLMEKLAEKFGNIYTDENVILSGTHTHSAPAGFEQYFLFQIPSLGFVEETFDVMLEGIYKSIEEAHNNIRKGSIFVSTGELLDASINRSPSVYETNPKEEREKYEHNTDKTMTLLKFVDVDGKDLGMINWFATHGTSMNNTNELISGDNKGYASQLFEERMNNDALPGKGPFVAAFAQANSGDASPNTEGAKCQDTGLPCEVHTSTCNGNAQLCIASGPGRDMIESTKIIGERQFIKAWELFSTPSLLQKLSGPVQYKMQYINMANFTFRHSNGSEVTTCKPALGYSFAAGTTDGPGAPFFTQGTTEESLFLNIVLGAITSPAPEDKACHAPKPILLNTGSFEIPYQWHPKIVDTQVGRIGNFFIVAVPGEITTMAGRRLREMIVQSASDNGLQDSIAVIAGLCNVYTHYITTYEEYQVQRYERASTIYGPNTHEAYMYQYSFLLDSMAKGTDIDKGPPPPDMYHKLISLLPPNLFDTPLIFREFGDVISQPRPFIQSGETQEAVFVGGSPRNNVRLEDTFLTVEKKMNETQWKIVATDSSFETRFMFEKSLLLGTGEVTVYWDVPLDTPKGIYRIKHFGNYRTVGTMGEYEGLTEVFVVN